MMGRVQAAAPRTIPEISALVGGFNGRIAYIAGGTDLIIALDHETPPDVIVDISQIADLAGIDVYPTHILIGAATTLAALAEHPVLRDRLPVLTQAAGQVGSVQIRNRATLGGNIASAVPAGDLLPALKCLDARINVLTRAGAGTASEFDEIVTGMGETSLSNGDLITGICIPLARGKTWLSAFAKLGRRATLSIARLNLAAVADYDRQQNRLRELRVVAGAIGPVPVRLQALERRLRARIVDQSFVEDFLHALTAAVDAAIPGRCSHAYKRRAVVGLGLDLLRGLLGRDFELAAAVSVMP